MKYKIGKSKIEGAGKGLLVKKAYRTGEIIGLAHIDDQPATSIGKFHNHSEEPTAGSIKIDNRRYLVAMRDLEPGDEITTDYRQQPELEQPEDFKRGGSTGLPKMPKPSKKGVLGKGYSRSLEATNRLFTENKLFAKPKSRKRKVFDPNAAYKEGGTSGCPPGQHWDGKKCVPNEERTLTNTAVQFAPVYETYLDLQDIYNGISIGDAEQLNRGIIGLGSPMSGKALTNSIDYVTEKTLGKSVADKNATKRNDVLNMSNAERQKLYVKYGPGGYDKWVKDGKPKLTNGGSLPQAEYGMPLGAGMSQNYQGRRKFIHQDGGTPEQEEPTGGIISQEEMDASNNAMMRARLAYAQMHGNPAAQRMVVAPDQPYVYTGEEYDKDWDMPVGVPAGETGTHYMASFGNYAVPFIQQGPNSLQFNESPSIRDREAIRFDNEADAEYFGGHYKEVAPDKSYRRKIENGSPYTTSLFPEDEEQFQIFYSSLPDNLQSDDPSYDIRGYWDSEGRPEEFDYSQPKEDDGYYHAYSINQNTGEYLKSPWHPTFQHAVDEDRKIGYRPVVNVKGELIATENPSIADSEEQTFLRSTEGPVNYTEAELTEEEIEEYRRGGWIVEEY